MLQGILAGILFAGSVFGSISSSPHYQLQSFGINSGGSNTTASTNYKARAASGEVSGGSIPFSTHYNSFNSSIGASLTSEPPPPTVDNGSGAYYNKLHVVINNSANTSSATFAVKVLLPDGVTTEYWQADGTLGANPVYQSYAAWGGASGSFITGLTPNSTYYVSASAQENKFGASAFGSYANTTTGTPSLTFSVSPSTVNLGTLNSGSIVTSSALTFGFTTNGANGGFIYMAGSATGLVSSSNSNYNIHVAAPSGDIGSLAEGAGLQATGTASMVAQTPYSNTGTVVGAFYTTFQPLFIASAPVTTGSATAVVKAKAQGTTPSGSDYTNTLTFVAAASY